jgi:hypothetical protein
LVYFHQRLSQQQEIPLILNRFYSHQPEEYDDQNSMKTVYTAIMDMNKKKKGKKLIPHTPELTKIYLTFQ